MVNKCSQILYILSEFLKDYPKLDISILEAVEARKNGKHFSIEEHIRGMIFSLLSNQRDWGAVYENKKVIEQIFFNFDKDKLKNTDYAYFVNALKSRKLANRSINAQMQNLKYNIEVFEQIEKEYFSLDYFITTLKPAAVAVLFASTESPYKLKQMKFALVLEYLRNVGIDTAKPDVHIVRILKRLGLLNKSGNEEKQVINILEKISLETGISVAKIDFLLWHYCSENFCNICSANPKCSQCVIKEFCNKEEICL